MNKKPKIVKRSVKHTYTRDETQTLYVEFRQSFADLNAIESEADAIKNSYKAKTSAAESNMKAIDAKLQAGFDMRDKLCLVIYDIPNGKKNLHLCDEKGALIGESEDPILTEALTDADRQQELIDAESVFEAKEDIELFKAAGQDAGILTVGRLEGKWFAALRVKIGSRVLTERLDGEQPATKKRPDAVRRAVKRFVEWVGENLGAEAAKGFINDANLAIVAHAEREE